MQPDAFAKRMHTAAEQISRAEELLRKIAIVVEGAAKRRSPVKTGNLRRSVTSRATETQAYVGATANYAYWVHEGHGHTQGNPFIQVGIDDSVPEIQRIAEQYGATVLERVGSGGGG